MKNFSNFILESYGKNELVVKLTKYLTDIINYNFGKLLLHENMTLKNSLKDFKEIIFENDEINIEVVDGDSSGYIDRIEIEDNKIIDLIMNLELNLSEIEKSTKKLNYHNLSKIINHEFLHVIERYLTISNDKEISKSWEYGKRIQKLQKKYPDYKEWQDVSYFIYLTFPHEMRSRVSALYEEIDGLEFKDIKNVIEFIKKNKYYKDADFLTKIDINILMKKLKMNQDYNNLLLDFNNDFLLNNKKDLNLCELEFIKYIKMIKMKNEKLKKKLIRISYSFENTVFDFGFPIDRKINYNDYLI